LAAARRHGQDVGIYAQRLLDDKLPWTRMRQVYRLLALARRYGDTPVNTACGRALALDVVSVTKIASMLEKASETTPPPPPRPRRPVRSALPATRPSSPATAAADPHQRWTGAVMTKTSVPGPVSVDLKQLLRALKLGKLLDTLPERITWGFAAGSGRGEKDASGDRARAHRRAPATQRAHGPRRQAVQTPQGRLAGQQCQGQGLGEVDPSVI
jgi:hypothetical protein